MLPNLSFEFREEVPHTTITDSPLHEAHHNEPPKTPTEPISPTVPREAQIPEPTPNVLSPQIPEPSLLRHSTLYKKPPAWHKDYVMSSHANYSTSGPSSPSSTRYPISTFLSYSRFSSTQRSFLANITGHIDPKSYAQAIHDPNWQQAMNAELK